jgi:hypothetical protein
LERPEGSIVPFNPLFRHFIPFGIVDFKSCQTG